MGHAGGYRVVPGSGATVRLAPALAGWVLHREQLSGADRLAALQVASPVKVFPLVEEWKVCPARLMLLVVRRTVTGEIYWSRT